MKAFFVITSLVLFSCSAKVEQEEKKPGQNGKDPDSPWLTIYNADSARSDFAHGKNRILVYGLRAMQMPGEVNDSLCRVYHFTEYQAADCEVTDRFLKGADEYNHEMYILLERINGKGWKDKYDGAYDSLAKVYREKNRREGMEEDSLFKIHQKIRRKNDSLEAIRRKFDSIAYRKRMNDYKKQLEAEKGK